MALQKTTVTGNLVLADESHIDAMWLEFIITSVEDDSPDIIVTEPVIAEISDSDGSFSVDLWPNSLGDEDTVYRVFSVNPDLNSPDRESYKKDRKFLGTIAVPTSSPALFADVFTPGTVPDSTQQDALTRALAAVSDAESAQAAAETAETNAEAAQALVDAALDGDTIWLGARNAANLALAAASSDGTLTVMDGYVYETDSSVALSDSCGADQSVAGLKPWGTPEAEHYGFLFDESDERDKLIRMMRHSAPGTAKFRKRHAGNIIGLSESIQIYDRTVFPVRTGGIESETPWVYDSTEFSGDGSTSQFTVTYPLYRAEVYLDDFRLTKKLQPVFTDLIVGDYTKENDYQFNRPNKRVDMVIPPVTGQTLRVESMRPGIMLKAVGDWASLSLNIQRNNMIAPTNLLTDDPEIGGLVMRNVGFDCNGRASTAIRGSVRDPVWSNLYVFGALSYSLQGAINGHAGCVESVTIDHVFPAQSGKLDTGVTLGEDVVVPAKEAFVSGAQDSDPNAANYVFDFFNDGVTVTKNNNGWDHGGNDFVIRDATIYMHGSDWEAAYWGNGQNGSSITDMTLYDGVAGGEQCLSMTYTNLKTRMSGILDENRLSDPEDLTASSWSRNACSAGVSSETPPSGIPTPQLLTTSGAALYPRAEQTVSLRFSSVFFSFFAKAGTSSTVFIEVTGTDIGESGQTNSMYSVDLTDGSVSHTQGYSDALARSQDMGSGWYRVSMMIERCSTVTKVGVRPIRNSTSVVDLHLAGFQMARRSQSYCTTSRSLGARINIYEGAADFASYNIVNPELLDNGASSNVAVGITTGISVSITGGRTECDIAINAHPNSVFSATGFNIVDSGQGFISTGSGFNDASTVSACPGLSVDREMIISGRTQYLVESWYSGAFAASGTHTVQFDGADLEGSTREVYRVRAYKNANAGPERVVEIRWDNEGNPDIDVIKEAASPDLAISTSGDTIVITNNNAGSVASHVVTERIA